MKIKLALLQYVLFLMKNEIKYYGQAVINTLKEELLASEENDLKNK
jgi:hypothetical protein